MTRVYCSMVCDLFHMGHVQFLQKVRETIPNSFVIVGLLGDDGAKEYKRTPICSLQERKIVVSACRFVDQVIAPAPLWLTEQFLSDNQIDLLAHGSDWSEKLDKVYSPATDRNIVIKIPYTEGISTTMLINRVIKRAKEF